MPSQIHQSIIRDPIHGDILIPSDVRQMIDTQTFQRLRYIQQLATCHYAFPAATHTRFSHSIGAFHLASNLILQLHKIYPGVISEEDGKLVTYGALLHDIGHPPFSHMLETPEIFANYMTHEQWGKHLLLDPEGDLRAVIIKLVGESGLNRLIAIMEGNIELPALHEMVSSQLDVDRLDYLLRDQHFTGVEVGGFDITRLFRSLRLSDEGRLAMSREGIPIVESYLLTRWHMYHLVYFHRITVLTQVYITRALQRARVLYQTEKIKLTDPLHHILINSELTPAQYCQLTDYPVMSTLFEWTSHPYVKLSTLAQRVISRSGFHRRVTPLKISAARKMLPQLKQIISKAGYSPEDDLILARVQKRGYLPYEEGIIMEDGSDIREQSKLVKALEGKIDEVMIFVPEECVQPCSDYINTQLFEGN